MIFILCIYLNEDVTGPGVYGCILISPGALIICLV